MEEYKLTEFKQELSQLKEYIKHIQKVDSLASIEVPSKSVFQDFKTHFLSFKNDKKLFEYKAIIISLYGLLEKYIELWVKDYLSSLSSLISYNNLDKKFQKNHFKLSMKLINIIIEGQKAKYSHLSKEVVLKNLNACIENPQSYKFNLDAFTMQTGNLKHSRVNEIFSMLNISIGKELLKNEELTNLIGVGLEQVHNTEDDVLFAKINELVERRNEIAHGAEIDDLLNQSALEPYINFLEKYCIAIFLVLKEKDIQNHTLEKFQEYPCQRVFKRKAIIGLSLEKHIIKVGDWLIIKTAEKNNEHFYKKKINSLGKDNKNDYEEITIDEKQDISIKIDNSEGLPITERCAFYLEKQL